MPARALGVSARLLARAEGGLREESPALPPAGLSRFQLVPASSAAASLPATAEPLREAGGTSGKRYLTKAKRLPVSEEKQGRKNPVRAGWGSGRALGGLLAAGQGQPTTTREIRQFLMKSQRRGPFFSWLVYLSTAKRRGGAAISLHIQSEQQFLSSNR